jgi:hypothetical protein
MNYQLVLQWPTSSIDDCDAIVEIEDALTKGLVAVDGDDIGSGEVNIFIHTDDPIRTFEEVRFVLGLRTIWSDIRVAYRALRRRTTRSFGREA